ncbi:MAG TPA: hypothetical protein VIV66_01275 [Pyrinomonadaceae bacterium]
MKFLIKKSNEVTMMNTGQRLGLLLLYVVLAGYAAVMVRIFVQVLFRPAIEKHRRRQFTKKNGGAAYPPTALVGKRGWANTWMPRNPEINQPAQNAPRRMVLTKWNVSSAKSWRRSETRS